MFKSTFFCCNKKAEQLRIAEQQRLAAIAEQQRLAAIAEQQRLAEQERLAAIAEQQRLAAIAKEERLEFSKNAGRCNVEVTAYGHSFRSTPYKEINGFQNWKYQSTTLTAGQLIAMDDNT